ncbi:N-acetylmuramoyl-L-alanine amidase [Flavobacterium capsici]|uniref:N-acetylmuramoyl-L-alanine amidase n=2 Tax=Flavobacterium capsici TaxID=3075618 RepID=A0AA96EVA2_9FLAO|nr:MULTISPECIES: N-acetylmuramoyl-L-alanine amidase [unclassified Flavobacterium]WNM18891.1 N-acetylmuramoyl-L-alanine amidase [Flavobacterium sp. PMR2A8]WNM22941.1 N-acetylmuramoyl-L-alanine amidase [Flavobacterium sp. PMTSA4]
MDKKLKIVMVAITLLVTSFMFSQGSKKFKVTLDAGHGDHDFGAVYDGRIEKKIALAVVLKVGKILEKSSDIDVIYTRKTDVFIDLIERANISNRADADIFVSIHCNANKNREASGCETYVMGMSKNASNLEAAKKENQVITLEKDYQQKYKGFDPKSPESMLGLIVEQEEYLSNSIELAGNIQKEFINVGKKSRGVKQAPFMVLHKAYMPRVLIEMGFISNPTEGSKLDSEEGQDEIAEAIAKAIVRYKKEYYGTGSDANEKPSDKIEPTVVDSKPATNNPTTATPKVEDKPKETPKEVAKGIVFKVQISASSTKLELAPSNFKGLSPISMLESNKFYKYMYGETKSYSEAKSLLQEAKAKGFETAFVIALKDGVRIDISEALKQL